MNNKNENPELEQKRLSLEKQIAIGIWIQVIGATIEFLGIAKLRGISENPDSIPEKEVLSGAGIQALGTFFEAIGVTGQITEIDNTLKLDAQKLAITGDWLQSIGAALEATGGTGEFLQEQEKANLFVP
ncbi:hypothetical protein [Bacillus xiapuensis]|uniref:Uncharacterized protein n=1 Tax=Bacillus xiapuensis TaxID=2014075 RepID=A0ABU6NAI3_9BACI|nr:hypothetical protein [Bacillus xiapuensis]